MSTQNRVGVEGKSAYSVLENAVGTVAVRRAIFAARMAHRGPFQVLFALVLVAFVALAAGWIKSSLAYNVYAENAALKARVDTLEEIVLDQASQVGNFATKEEIAELKLENLSLEQQNASLLSRLAIVEGRTDQVGASQKSVDWLRQDHDALAQRVGDLEFEERRADYRFWHSDGVALGNSVDMHVVAEAVGWDIVSAECKYVSSRWQWPFITDAINADWGCIDFSATPVAEGSRITVLEESTITSSEHPYYLFLMEEVGTERVDFLAVKAEEVGFMLNDPYHLALMVWGLNADQYEALNYRFIIAE